jgi:hypothetical protein
MRMINYEFRISNDEQNYGEVLWSTFWGTVHGARSGNRTHTDLHPRDFKSLVSTIPPPGHYGQNDTKVSTLFQLWRCIIFS